MDLVAQDGRSAALPAIHAEVRDEADNAAETTAMLALWAFLTMLIGAAASVMGGVYDARPHAWLDRFERRRATPLAHP